ncbi:cutinase family protein [Rhodococcus sp. X156]|uniref:cutinase family protein n=1 Tax=Rhodococcus sp. X156 TaxID=2499145 RepID=UPI000FD6CEE0|nr:cutinase family protein [Rhodococcus sp. X156]
MSNAYQPRKRRWGIWLVVLVALVVVGSVLTRLPGSGPDMPEVAPGPGSTATQPPGSSAQPPATSVKPAGCPDVQVVFVPGTYETNPGANPGAPAGLLAAVANPLTARFGGDAGRVSTYFVPYLAQFNNPTPYLASEQDGVRAARAAIAETTKRCATTKFALVGFSQGAAVAGDLAAEIGQGGAVIPPEKLIGVGLVSDPNRNGAADRLIGPAVAGAGLGGPRPKGFGAVGDRVVTFCAPGDLICATPPSATNLANLPATLALVGQYMQSNVHSSYATYKVEGATSATQWLAGWLAARVEEVPKG